MIFSSDGAAYNAKRLSRELHIVVALIGGTPYMAQICR
jgi:hypothetical protein